MTIEYDLEVYPETNGYYGTYLDLYLAECGLPDGVDITDLPDGDLPEGDMSMLASLNLQITLLNSGVDANLEWQWDGGHVPSEVFSESFSLYVDQMYGEYVNGNEIATPAAEVQSENGTATEASGTDLSSWVDYSDLGNVSFSLADIAAYRSSGASKAIPGFDVIDYGQEDYVFGSSEQDARYWNKVLLEIFEEHADVLEELFNSD